MQKAASDRLRRGIDRAFEMATEWSEVTSGPFAFTVGMDARAMEFDFLRAFPMLGRGRPPEFQAVIIGGDDPVLRSLLPSSDVGHLHTDGEVYAFWVGAPHNALFAYDFRERRGMMWLAEGRAQYWLRCRPLMPILHAFATATDWCPVHMAAVGRNGKFILLSGASGAGKSTAALACLMAGWDFAGDDVVIVNAAEKRVASLFVSARVRKNGLSPLHALVDAASIAESNENDDPRFELRVEHMIRGSSREGHVAAIVLPRRRGDTPFRYRAARPFEVFSATMPYTSVLAPGMHDVLMPKLLNVARMAPAFITDTGNDPLAIPAALDEFLERQA